MSSLRIPRTTIILGAVGALLVGSVSASASTPGQITEFTVPTAGSQPYGIAVDLSGNVWFTEMAGNKIGKMTPAGAFTEFPVPTPAALHFGSIALGPDGNMWFAEFDGNKIGRITPAGTITEFGIPTAASEPSSITPGPDGNMWFVEQSGNKIGRITPAGTITEFPVPTPASVPRSIIAGSDGNMWFTEREGNKIGKITTSGVITEFPVPTAGSGPRGIAAGSDGRLWFAERNVDKVGRITVGGHFAEFSVPADGPYEVATASDGRVWMTATNPPGTLASISPAGDFDVYSIPTVDSQPALIAAAPDGSVWFTESVTNKIARVSTGYDPAKTAPKVTGPGTTGQALTCGEDVWAVAPSTTTHGWSANGTVIAGQTGATFTPAAADVGKNIGCSATATLPGVLIGQTAASSNTVTVVNPGTQTLPFIRKTLRRSKKMTLPAATLQSQPVTYANTTRWICKLSGRKVTGKRVGKCRITATAPAAGTFSALTTTVKIKIKR